MRELDFRGNRAFVYRLSIKAGPRVVAAVPSAGRAGATRDVEFFGFGLHVDRADLGSIRKTITFPEDDRSSLNVQLETPHGIAGDFSLQVSDLPELVHPGGDAYQLDGLPAAITGVLNGRITSDRFRFAARQNDVWAISAQSATMIAPLDLNLSIVGPDGTTLADNDDLTGTTDAGLLWAVPADGEYEAVVSDSSGNSGRSAAVYRFVIDRPRPDFALTIPQRQNVTLGENAELIIKAIRRDGFGEPIEITLGGLPSGISVPEDMTIAAGADELKIPLKAAADAPASSAFVKVTGTATIDQNRVIRVATAETPIGSIDRLLVATIMKPRIAISPIESDERTVHRGSTHLAPIQTKRLEGYQDPFVIQTDAIQSHKFRQGLLGPDVIVPSGAESVFYPCFVPERSETLDAYRMLLIAVAPVRDPQGRQRYLVSRMPAPDNSIAITVEGALLKLSLADDALNLRAQRDKPVPVPLQIFRSAKLTTPIQLEAYWLADPSKSSISRDVDTTKDRITVSMPPSPPIDNQTGTTLMVRATTMQMSDPPRLDEEWGATPMPTKMLAILKSGRLPLISELRVSVEFDRRRGSNPDSN